MRAGRRIVPILAVAIAALTMVACGDDADVLTATLEPAKDNTLYENPAGERSNGAGEHLFIGATNAQRVRRAVLMFDVQGALPAGAEVRSVTLTLVLNRGRNSDAHDTTLHRVLADWGEGASDAVDTEGPGTESEPGDATWLHRFYDDQLWENEGGDFVVDASASLETGAVGSYTWESTERLVDDVQAWLDAPQSNFGWIVRGGEDERGSSKRLHSRESADTSVRPTLIIEYIPPE